MTKYKRLISEEESEELLDQSASEDQTQDEDVSDDVDEDDEIIDEDEDDEEGSEEPDEESDNSDEQPEKKSETKFNDGFAKKYQGKSPEELLEIIHNQEQYIGKQSSEIGKLKKTVTSEPSVRQEADNLEKQIEKLSDEIDGIDLVIEPDKFKQKNRELNKLQQQRQKLDFKLYMAEEMAKRQNQQVIADTKEYYAKNFKKEFSEDEWSDIYQSAIKYSSDGVITKEDVDSAILKTVGRENFHATLMGQGSLNTRQDIKKARAISSVPQLGQKSAKADNTTDIYSMSPDKARRVLDDMSDEDFMKKVLPKTPFAYNKQQKNKKKK